MGAVPSYYATLAETLRTRAFTVLPPFTVGLDFLPGTKRRVSSALFAPIVWRNESDLEETRVTGVVMAEFSLNEMLSIGMRGDGGLDIVVQGFSNATGTPTAMPGMNPRTIHVRGGVVDLNSSAPERPFSRRDRFAHNALSFLRLSGIPQPPVSATRLRTILTAAAPSAQP